MKTKNKLVVSIFLVMMLGIILAMNVSACGLMAVWEHTAAWASTTTSVIKSSTYNNELYAQTLAWSVNSKGEEKYHQGPSTRKYNKQEATSKVWVPLGQGTWFECHYEGKCNRCGEIMGKGKHMFAF